MYFAYGFYGFTLLLNIAVLFIGREVAGADRGRGAGYQERLGGPDPGRQAAAG